MNCPLFAAAGLLFTAVWTSAAPKEMEAPDRSDWALLLRR
jgi:hypothetical protein